MTAARAYDRRDALRCGEQIKGAALREFIDWYGQEFGGAVLARHVASLPAPLRDLFDSPEAPVLASSWYPGDAVGALLDALVGKMDASARKSMTEAAGEHVMAVTLSGVYRFVFRAMLTPERYAAYSQLLWNRYYDGGTVQASVPEPGVFRSSIAHWDAHHPVICDLNVVGTRYAFEAMGCQAVRVQRARCVSEGASDCTFVARWSP